MKRSESYRRKVELINEIEKHKTAYDKFGNNSWAITLRSASSTKSKKQNRKFKRLIKSRSFYDKPSSSK